MSGVTFQDTVIPGSKDDVGLSLLVGKRIKEVRGYFSDIGGGAAFKIHEIEFEDGTFVGVEGEHDFPYITEYRKYPQPNFDEDTLERLMAEQNGDEYESVES